MSDPFPNPKFKQIGANFTHYIQKGFFESNLESGFGCQSFQCYKISEDCPNPYAEYKEFCRVNEYRLRKVEKVDNHIYVQLGTQSNVHASACSFVQNIINTHNAAHPSHSIRGRAGGKVYCNDNEFEPDFRISPVGLDLRLGPTVVGEIQYASLLGTPQVAKPNLIGCDKKAGIYLRQTDHIGAFICVDIQFPWSAGGYPKITLFYFDRPDQNPASVLYLPTRVVNIGRILDDAERSAMVAKYPNLDDTSMFGNGFGGCGDCHPAADPMHFVFEIPGPAVLFVDPGHTLAAGNMPIEEVAVGIEVDCRVLLNKILEGAVEDGLCVNFPNWPWDTVAAI